MHVSNAFGAVVHAAVPAAGCPAYVSPLHDQRSVIAREGSIVLCRLQGACIQQHRTMLVTECESLVRQTVINRSSQTSTCVGCGPAPNMCCALRSMRLRLVRSWLPLSHMHGMCTLDCTGTADCDGGNLTRNLMAGRVTWYRRGKKVKRHGLAVGD